MRSVPVDLDRLSLIATGKVTAKTKFNEDRNAPRVQETSPTTGRPLWQIDAVLDDDDAARSEVLSVTVDCDVQPVVPKWRPLAGLSDVVAYSYVKRGTTQIATSLTAGGFDRSAAEAGHDHKGQHKGEAA